jgi:epoxyqueuosine reductase
MSVVLSEELVEWLRGRAPDLGFARLGVARLDDPRLQRSREALAVYDVEGRAGEMAFMTKTIALRQRPELLLEGARTAIVGLVAYDGEPGPFARYTQFFDYHTDLHRRMLGVAAALAEVLPGLETLVCVDTKPVPERALAMIAGLGFIGKHGCLIAPGLGSQVLIGVLLTTAALAEDGPDLRAEASSRASTEGPRRAARVAEAKAEAKAEAEAEAGARAGAGAPWDACGRCRACLDACPTDAFIAPGVLDPRRCISYLTIEHRAPISEDLLAGIGERVAGCDVCQEVCPYNRGASVRLSARGSPPHEHAVQRGPQGDTSAIDVTNPARVHDRSHATHARERGKLRPHEDGRASPSLAQLATIRNRRYKALVKHSAVDRIPRRTMHRNALIALGNVACGLDDPARAALAFHLLGEDEELRALASRAWRRREREDPPETTRLAARYPELAAAQAASRRTSLDVEAAADSAPSRADDGARRER